LLKWIHGVLVGASAEDRLVRAWRERHGGEATSGEYEASAHDERLRELRDEASNLLDAIAHGALRSSPMLAERLAQAESKLASE
jgi:hypothetical protein